MRITLFGAGGGEVTGSAYLVESGKSKVLIDCGLFQGVPNADRKNRISKNLRFAILIPSLLPMRILITRDDYRYWPSENLRGRFSVRKLRQTWRG